MIALKGKAQKQGDLCAALQEHFECGPGFTRAYLAYFEKAQAVSLRHPRDLNALTPTQDMWFQYALSTNQRGRDLIHAMGEFKPFRSHRYLDIGCGFGGCLVAAARQGARSVGLEVDEQRIEFARLNVKDWGADGTVEVMTQDVLAPDISQRIGSFDLISCNDVAEHVDNVELLFQNIGRLLEPDGLVYMEIPNRYCVDFVAQDGHFGLFGITLLERPEARQYHWELFRYTYDVGDYLRLEQYLALFQKFGMEPRLIPSLYHAARDISELGERVKELERAYLRFQGIAGVDSATRGRVLEAYEEYRKELIADRREATTAAAREQFRNKYLRAFWTFAAVKSVPA